MAPNLVENLVYLCIPSVFITSCSQTQTDMQGLITCSITARAGTYTAGDNTHIGIHQFFIHQNFLNPDSPKVSNVEILHHAVYPIT